MTKVSNGEQFGIDTGYNMVDAQEHSSFTLHLFQPLQLTKDLDQLLATIWWPLLLLEQQLTRGKF